MGLLRVLLVVCVLFGHSAPLVNLNWIQATRAVEVFFAISGFYMQLVLAEKYTPARLGKRWIVNFYLARYTRLYPAYIVCFVLVILVGLLHMELYKYAAPPLKSWAEVLDLKRDFNNIALGAYVVFTNLSIFLQDLGGVLAVRDGEAMFATDRADSQIYIWSTLAIPQAWSLGVELMFYLLAPFVFKLRNGWLLLLTVLFLLVKVWAIQRGGLADLPYRMFPFTFVYFLAGALAYRYRGAMDALGKLPDRSRLIAAYALAIILATCIPDRDGLLSIGFVMLTVVCLPSIFGASRHSRLDGNIGECSYPFYIFHVLILQCIRVVLGKFGIDANAALTVAAALCGSLVVSFAVSLWDIRYLEPFRKRYSRPREGSALAPPPVSADNAALAN